MPFIRVDWFPGRTLEQKRELAEVLTREFARIAKCKPETINFIFKVAEKIGVEMPNCFVMPMNMKMIPSSRQLVPFL
jgi:4-oxalocrotonate tautomerase